MKRLKRKFIYRKAIVCCCCFAALFSATFVRAQAVRIDDAQHRPSPRGKTTYQDLIKKIFPDARGFQITVIEEDKPARVADRIQAARSVPLRNLFGRFENVSLKGLMSIKNLAAVRLRTRGGERLVLAMSVNPVGEAKAATLEEDILEGRKESSSARQKAADSDESDGKIAKPGNLNILALFRLAPTPVLLDAVDVNHQDEYSTLYFSDRYLRLKIRPREEGFFIVNKTLRTDPAVISRFYSLLTTTGDRLKMLTREAIQVDESNDCISANNSSISFTSGGAARRKNGFRPLKVKEVRFYTNRTKDCKAVSARFRTTTVSDLIWNKADSQYDLVNTVTRTKYYDAAPRRKPEKSKAKKGFQ